LIAPGRTDYLSIRAGLACYLPVKAPWLNAIEPKWVHGKRAIIEPGRKLTAAEVMERVWGYYGCEQLDRLTQQVA